MRGLKPEASGYIELYIKSHLLQMRGLKHGYKHDQNPRPLSHLLQMRGLKQCNKQKLINGKESHLLQMRGLKLIRIVIMVDQLKSHLLQMRGLKPRPSMDSHRQNQVASFTDAWIETCAAMARFWRLRRIFYRCVD